MPPKKTIAKPAKTTKKPVKKVVAPTRTTKTKTKSTVAKVRTSVVRTVGPMIPLAIALAYGAATGPATPPGGAGVGTSPPAVTSGMVAPQSCGGPSQPACQTLAPL